jgi:protein-S-isoprenylcysteine O-methyltransferase Ste14
MEDRLPAIQEVIMERQSQPVHSGPSRPESLPAVVIDAVDRWDCRLGSAYAQFMNRRSMRVLGRMTAALFLAMLMSAQMVAITHILSTDRPATGDLNIWMMVLHHLLQAIFVGIVVLLVVFRRPAQAGAARFSGMVAALAGTFALSLLVIEGTGGLRSDLVPLAVLLLLLGMSWAIWSLRTLGRCFSILPEVRGLVTSGPYRWVRHPVYLGEMIAGLGLLLPILSPRNVIVFALFFALQLWRTRYEETGLATAFPEYGQYRQRTARLLPGLW